MPIPVGVVLSGSTTKRAIAQLYADYEGKVYEGELCFIRSSANDTKYLCRIDKIVPFSEFFEEGDAWSEARRRMAPVPYEISRKYYTLELEILGEVKGGSLSEVTLPPAPGDEVFRIEDEKEIVEIINLESNENVLIKFGTLFGYRNVPLYLDLDTIPMHLAILGVTGSGKSYTVGYFLEQVSDITIKKNFKTALPTIIIDANGDYLDYHEYVHKKGQRMGNYTNVIRFVFNTSPAKLSKGVKTISIDLDVFEPREVAELIITYYTGGYLNELQVAGIELALRKLCEEEGYSISSLFLDESNWGKIILELEKASRDKLIHDQTLKAIRRALEKFRLDVIDKYELVTYKSIVTLSSDFIDRMTEDPTLAIIDFSADGAPGVPLQLKQLVVSYITKLLFKKFTKYKIEGEDRILLLIIEEAQNYCPNLHTFPIGYSLARDNLAQIATQGRKFGLSLCLVSQRPSFVDPVVLSMVNSFIIHRISAEDVSFVRKVAGGLPKVIEDKLTNLATGRAIVTGQMNKLGFPVLVDIPERKVKPTIGKVSVSNILSKIASKSES